MKAILKTLPTNLEMRYDLKFGSEENTEILRQVIPRLVDALKRYKTTYKQIKEWLNALHKHRRVRLLYSRRGTLDRDNRRLHKNNRTNEVNKSIFSFKELQLTFRINIEKGSKAQRCQFVIRHGR
jgi:hypothetical protein